MLNKMNIIRFEQIAALTDDEIASIDEALKLGGRIEKEDWISQAQRLMAEVAAAELPPEEPEGGEAAAEDGGEPAKPEA